MESLIRRVETTYASSARKKYCGKPCQQVYLFLLFYYLFYKSAKEREREGAYIYTKSPISTVSGARSRMCFPIPFLAPAITTAQNTVYATLPKKKVSQSTKELTITERQKRR